MLNRSCWRRAESANLGFGILDLIDRVGGWIRPAMEAPASASAPVPAAVGGGAGASGSSGKVKRVMKTPYQLEVLERTYTGSWMMAYGGLGILEIFRAISCLICRFFDRNSPVISVLTWFCLCCCRGSVSK